MFFTLNIKHNTYPIVTFPKMFCMKLISSKIKKFCDQISLRNSDEKVNKCYGYKI